MSNKDVVSVSRVENAFSRLRAALAIQDTVSIYLTEGDLEILLTPPTQNIECWLTGVIHYFQTGDLVGAVAKVMQCLVDSGVNPIDILTCVIDFVSDLVDKVPIGSALITLLNCVLSGGGNGNGDVSPPGDGVVSRCGR